MFALFIAYLLAVAAITLGPAPAPDETLGIVRATVTWLNAHGVGVSYDGVEFAANVVMFVPFGVFVRGLLPTRPALLVIAIGAVTSLGIECAQLLLPTRVSDPRDIVANTLGTWLGVGIRAGAARWHTARQRPDRDDIPTLSSPG
ncbi:VanZ family protein [Cellulomonas humilata]|uniref:VanZ family protein n=1 Tax=Cellulomonas humilata TaxID=144055 RepID=UPI0031B5C92A